MEVCFGNLLGFWFFWGDGLGFPGPSLVLAGGAFTSGDYLVLGAKTTGSRDGGDSNNMACVGFLSLDVGDAMQSYPYRRSGDGEKK